MSAFDELRRRAIIRWVVAYLAGGWFFLEFFGFLAETFGWPPAVVRVASAVVLSGALTALILAWFHGERGRQRLTPMEVLLLLLSLVVMGGTGWRAWHVEPSTGGFDTLRAGISPRSIAVLPFTSSGSDVAEYYPDGIVEEILGRLSQVPDLQVASRTSSFAFRGDSGATPREIGERLRVAHLLEGQVQKAGETIRVRASLVSTESGLRLWTESYTMENPDVFDLQDKISRDVVESLSITLSRADSQLINTPSNRSAEAFDLFAQGRALFYTGGKEALERSVELYDRAIELDEDYALAYSGKVDSYLILGFNYVAPTELLPDARQAARAAVRLAPGLAAAHISLGFVQMVSGELTASEESFKRAIELDPGNPDAHRWYSALLTYLSRFREGLEEMRIAERLEPWSVNTRAEAVLTLYYARQFEAARERATRVIEFDTTFARIRLWRGFAEEMLGDYQAALFDYRSERGVRTGARAHEVRALAALGREREARIVLDELIEARDTTFVEPFRVALAFTALGEHDTALTWLEEAYDHGSFHLITLDVEPMLDPLRRHPRFENLRRRMGLTH